MAFVLMGICIAAGFLNVVSGHPVLGISLQVASICLYLIGIWNLLK